MLVSGAGISIVIEPSGNDDEQGVTAIEGFLSYGASVLTLEYRSQNEAEAWSDLKTLAFPLADLSDLEIEKRFLGWRILLRARRMSLLDGLPGTDRGEVRLRIARRDRDRALNLVTQIRMELSELRLWED